MEHAHNLIDMVGCRVGKLIVVARAPNGKNGQARWFCKCDCGGETTVFTANLRKKDRMDSYSCGCSRSGEKIKTHGKSRTKEHNIWFGMRNRCHLPTCGQYHKYGARGVTVCERWNKTPGGFENFLADMGPMPSPDHTIDRYPDNDGNYEPTNCRWATLVEQANNKKSNVRVTFMGRVMPLMEAVRLSGSTVKSATIRGRVRKGISFEDALS